MRENTRYPTIPAGAIAGALTSLVALTTTIGAADAFNARRPEQPQMLHYVNNGVGFNVENINGNSGEDIYVKIQYPPDSVAGDGKKSWVRIIGMPETISFSKGTKINDVWFLSLADLDNLVLKSPDGYRGNFEAKFFLMRGSRTVVSIVGKATIQVDLNPRRKVAARTSRSFTSPTEEVRPRSKLAPYANTEAERRMEKRAKKLLKMGDFASARLIYENYALKGSARAAFGMGQTYDPMFLKKFIVRGLKPNPKKAKQWYQKAIELGSQRLNFHGGRKLEFEDFVQILSEPLGYNSRRVTDIQREALSDLYKKL
ncbi:MAG: hypothetical protein ACRBBN_00585 [Methyloligellaceae bacterium]